MLNRKRLDAYGDVLTPQDVRDILGIGLNKTYELLKSGNIKNFKIGRCRKIPKHCLEEYLNSMVTDSAGRDTYHTEGGKVNDDHPEN
jgi:excisionase family DNA binding protein